MMPESGSQDFVVEEDINLPEYKPDIRKILKSRGQVPSGEINRDGGTLLLQGRIHYEILYQGEGGALDVLRGSVEFRERIPAESELPQEQLFCKVELEDLGIVVINSRKLSLRCLCRMQKWPIASREILLPAVPKTQGDEQILPETRKIWELTEQKKDRLRLRQEILLPKEKPNIGNVLWQEIRLEQLRCAPVTEGLEMSGMLSVFVLYQPQGESGYVWYENTLPVTEHLRCSLPPVGGSYQVKILKEQTILDVAEDLDGEMRILEAECLLELRLCIWQEEERTLLKDAYSLSSELQVHCSGKEIWQVIMKNDAILPVEGEIPLPKDREALHVCTAGAICKNVTVKRKEQHLLVSGEWEVEALYVSREDDEPFAGVKARIPFHGELEAGMVAEGDYVETDAMIYRLQCSGVEGNRLLLRGETLIQMMVFHQEKMWLPDHITAEPVDMEQLRQQPGILGYVVQPQDRLWDIAKRFHTTPEELMETNHLEQDSLLPGQKLLIMKQVPMPV
jgi:hypothetical protein